jgi:hypothetical protein
MEKHLPIRDAIRLMGYMRDHDLDFAGLSSFSSGDLWLDGPAKVAISGIATGRFTAENYRRQWELIRQRAEWIISGDLSKAEIICLVADDSEAIMDEAARRDILTPQDMQYIYDRVTLAQLRAFAARARGEQIDPSFPEGEKLEWAIRLGFLDAQKELTPKGKIFFDGMGGSFNASLG